MKLQITKVNTINGGYQIYHDAFQSIFDELDGEVGFNFAFQKLKVHWNNSTIFFNEISTGYSSILKQEEGEVKRQH